MIGLDVVDLQMIRPRLADVRWCRLAFTEAELASVLGVRESTATWLLAQTWALKEAVVKANGSGFSGGISPREVEIGGLGARPALSRPLRNGCVHPERYLLSTGRTGSVVVGMCVISAHAGCVRGHNDASGGFS